MSLNLPADVIVHYSRSIPLRSITDVDHLERLNILESLSDENAWGRSRFPDPQYLKQRFEVEDKLRRQFLQLGDRPILQCPIYFFLGRNDQFEKQEMNIGYAIDLKEIDPSFLSYTYGDSLFCLIKENRKMAGSVPILRQLRTRQ